MTLFTRSSRRVVLWVAAVALCAGLACVAKASADPCDMHWASSAYRGTVQECTTNATVGLSKANFSNIGSKTHNTYTSIWGYHGSYYALVLCTKAQDRTTYAQMVIGPTGGELDSLYDALDKDFK